MTRGNDDNEDREVYRDEDDDDDAASNHLSASSAATLKMQPMSVSTGGDYHMSVTDKSNNRKAALASVLSIIFLTIAYFLTREHRAAKAAAAAAATKNRWSLPKGFCRGLDADYFDDLMNVTGQFPAGDKRLCSSSVPESQDNNNNNNNNKTKSCKCHHPFLPIPQDASPDWSGVVDMNIEYMKTTYSVVQPDVVLYGDSITEHLLGRNFGLFHKKYHETGEVAQSLLRKREGGSINGLPMAISGDQIAHLLYRLQNGELPSTLHPKVWWFLIGLNDIRAGCSENTIVAGNIRIAQEIHNRHYSKTKQHPSLTPIVINALLPRGSLTSRNRFVSNINRQLACYAAIKPDVYFVNTTDLFYSSNETGVFLNDDLFQSDLVHPSAEGTRKWLEVVVENVLWLMG